MCARYRPPRGERLLSDYDSLPPATNDYPAITFPGYRAPIIVSDSLGRTTWLAQFGMVAPWSRDGRASGATFNARSETVAEKASFRNAWRQGQFCLVPALAFAEPCYESGKNVWHEIERLDGRAMGIAGLWERWRRADREVLSFTMLTVNAAGHPIMQRMHRPGEEKRSVVVIPEASYTDWLNARNGRDALELLTLFDPSGFRAAPVRTDGNS